MNTYSKGHAKKWLKTSTLALSIPALTLLSSCGDASDGISTDAAPETLDGLELFFISGTTASFQFASISGDATTGVETGYTNSIRGGGQNTTITNSFGNVVSYEISDLISNVSYTYQKTGENTGTLIINAQTLGNSVNNLDIFTDSATGDEIIDMTLAITFGSSGGVIGEIAIDYSAVPSDNGDLSYSQTTAVDGITIQTQEGNAVVVGYTEDTANGVLRVTPDTIYPDVLSAAGELDMIFTSSGNTYDILGVSSDDQGFDLDAIDQGIVTLTVTTSTGVTSSDGTVSFAWYGEATTGSDTQAELHLERDSGTEVYLFDFSSVESGTFEQTSPASGITGTFDFPNLDS